MIDVKKEVVNITQSPDGQYLAYIMVDSTFEIYNLYNDKVVYKKKYNFTQNEEDFYKISLLYNFCAISVSMKNNDYKYVYYTNVYNFFEDEIVAKSIPYLTELLAPDYLISSSPPTPLNRFINLYIYNDAYSEFRLGKQYLSDEYFCLSGNNNGKFFVTSGPTLWNISTGESIKLNDESGIDNLKYVALSNNGKLIASISPDGRIVVWDIEKYITGVEDKPIIAEKEKIEIMPNPASDYINIQFVESGLRPVSTDIKIYNILGECVMTIPNTLSPNPRVDVLRLPAGIYFVIVKSNTEIITKQFVIFR